MKADVVSYHNFLQQSRTCLYIFLCMQELHVMRIQCHVETDCSVCYFQTLGRWINYGSTHCFSSFRNLFTIPLTHLYLQHVKEIPNHRFRYVDDILIIYNNLHNMNDMLNEFNNHKQNINFTIEEEPNNTIQFLVIKIK